jgi:hypothetical protein
LLSIQASKPRQRIADAARRIGRDDLIDNFMIYSTEDAERLANLCPSLGQIEPLNTDAGQSFMRNLCSVLEPDAVTFDNVQSLLAGEPPPGHAARIAPVNTRGEPWHRSACTPPAFLGGQARRERGNYCEPTRMESCGPLGRTRRAIGGVSRNRDTSRLRARYRRSRGLGASSMGDGPVAGARWQAHAVFRADWRALNSWAAGGRRQAAGQQGGR